tara:strand:+ start:686 stop:811 length:126 start_codon:yes stop_codon:yes gene_type:complete
MTAYSCGSGGVMFVPDAIEKTVPRVVLRRSNDNDAEQDSEE